MRQFTPVAYPEVLPYMDVYLPQWLFLARFVTGIC